MAQSAERWTLDFGSGHDLTVRGFQPRPGLCADSSEPASDSLSLPLSLFLPHLCSLSLSLSLSLKADKLKKINTTSEMQTPGHAGAVMIQMKEIRYGLGVMSPV